MSEFEYFFKVTTFYLPNLATSSWMLELTLSLDTIIVILLMEEILHHLGYIKPCKSWDKLPINWCRISSISSSDSVGSFYRTFPGAKSVGYSSGVPRKIGEFAKVRRMIFRPWCTPGENEFRSAFLQIYSIIVWVPVHTKIYANRLTPVSCWPEKIVGSVEDVKGRGCP